MTKLGILLLVFGVIFTIVSAIFLVGTESADPLLESLICENNETFFRTSQTIGNGEQRINFFCQKNDGGELREVGGGIMVLIFSSMLPILLGIILAVIGSTRKSSEGYATSTAAMQQKILERFGQGESTSFTVTSGMPQDVDHIISTVMGKLDNITTAQQLTVKQKLEQLREAYDAGLITYEEFELRKDRVLDEIAED